MNIVLDKSKKIIIIAIIVIIIVALVVFLVFKKNKNSLVLTNTTITTQSDQNDYSVFPVAKNNIQLKDGSDITIDDDNNKITYKSVKYNIGDLKSITNDFTVSTSGRYAVGQFFMIEDDAYYYYYLTPNNEPKKLDSHIEAIGAVLDDGKLIYYVDGSIAKGYYDRGSEVTLVPSSKVDAMYVGFARLNTDTLLYWGIPTQPEGLNMNLLNINTGNISQIISDHSVMDTIISGNNKKLIVRRYIDDSESNWLFDMENKSFEKKLSVGFDLSTAALNNDGSAIAYWQNNNVTVMDLNSAATKIIQKYNENDYLNNGFLSFSGDKIIISPK